jgi:hypothetical protein
MAKDPVKHGNEIQQFAADRVIHSELLQQHLVPCGNDLVLLTLKGHLIIENLLEMNLCRMLGLACFPEGEKENPNLEFHQKLRMVQAVVMNRTPAPKPNADLFCVITMLNKVRNDLAHKLEAPKEVEASVKRLVQSYQAKADQKVDTTKPLPDMLRTCIIKLCHFLDAVRVQSFKLDWYGEQ